MNEPGNAAADLIAIYEELLRDVAALLTNVPGITAGGLFKLKARVAAALAFSRTVRSGATLEPLLNGPRLNRRVLAFTTLLKELVAHQAEAFDADGAVSRTTLKMWFEDFREVVKSALQDDDPKLFVVVIGNPFDSLRLRGPFVDHDGATAWAEEATAATDAPWHIIEIEAPRDDD